MNVIPIYVVPQVANIFDMELEARIHMIISSVYGRSHFNLYRHTTNTLDFLLRDLDRQPKVQTGTILMVIYDQRDDIVLEVPLVIHDAPRAHYRAVISPNDLMLDLGNYTWMIRHTDVTTRLLYTNLNYETRGTITLQEGMPQPITPTVVVDNFLGSLNEFYSGAIDAQTQTGNHSLVIDLTNYTGTITVEVTQDQDAPTTNEGWAVLEEYEFTDATGLHNRNPTGNFTYMRFWLSSLTGMNSITYRN